MSDLRVALVAEGPTDAVLIGAALKAILPTPFILTQLQPEETRPSLGAGWGGVLRWCRQFAARSVSSLEDDPTLPGFDLFVVHLDADVADFEYADLGSDVALMAREFGWPTLPCSVPCPPPAFGADEVRRRLLAWASLAKPGPKTVLCVPSKASEAWLAAAVLEPADPLLPHVECNRNLKAHLAALPKANRVAKGPRGFRDHAETVTKAWGRVRQYCSQAERFSREVGAVIP